MEKRMPNYTRTSHAKMSSFSTRALTLLSSVFGACGLLLVGVAVSTDYWLLMEEGIVLQQNQTTEVKMALHSGLWRVCFVAGPEKGRCVASEYFTEPEIDITTENTANILSLSLVVGLVLYISSINDEVMNRPREPEQFFHYRYGWSFAFAASSFLLKEGAGVMSVYLFMKRYTEEELYRPHPALYRPRMSDCSDYSGQFLHPDSWPPTQRGRSASDVSSDISIQLNQTPPPQPATKGGSSSQPTPSSSGPSSAASYQLQPASSSSTSSSYPHPLHPATTSTLPRASHGHPQPHPHPSGPPPQSMPMVVPPSAVPPPRYHTLMRMNASPC
uniref:calcium channel, voltage-dependent, gamma subunit 7a isoform X3 n=1 Tax=Monopterus albus TaxID=43700 RepID=UPI0009B4C1CB|nr:voltage-dependent calcium channel gamma-7 subunit-like isoform X3 [Monopterus albus]